MCKLFQMILIFYHKAPATKNMKERNIGFCIVQSFIYIIVEAFVDDALVMNKACCCYCFCPKIKRQICEVKHWSSRFHTRSALSFYHVILLQCVWCQKVMTDSLRHQEVIQNSISELSRIVTSYLSDGKLDL